MSAQTPKPANDAGQAPQAPVLTSEEMDSPSRTMPPVVPILIAALIIGAILFFVVRSNRPVTPATGSITKVFYVEQNTKDRGLVGVEVHVKNGSEKPIYVHDVIVKVTTLTGDLTDTPAPSSDMPRYFQAYPALKQSNAEWMGDNTKIMPGAERDGLFIVGYAMNQDAWNQRKGLEVTINLYDQKPLVLKQ